ncbi:thioredoxin [Bradyrhizobium sp. Leaf396]|jgi:thioredoxin 1|uniref:thioredoxin family protein n=2 Tax=Bradyrhizobium TaxID=374 RepID=UPI000708E53E|nr:thioredoxin family protein [Bradyrhizobium sp. CCH5-F6]KQT20746.1 thioredoxin [Bradyrhizobium sp. Leaf396]
MKVEMFYSPGCAACEDRQAELRAAARDTVSGVEWCDVNVLENMDAAVALGVITLPSIVIDGEVAFTSLPTKAQLCKELIERRGSRK